MIFVWCSKPRSTYLERSFVVSMCVAHQWGGSSEIATHHHLLHLSTTIFVLPTPMIPSMMVGMCYIVRISINIQRLRVLKTRETGAPERQTS